MPNPDLQVEGLTWPFILAPDADPARDDLMYDQAATLDGWLSHDHSLQFYVNHTVGDQSRRGAAVATLGYDPLEKDMLGTGEPVDHVGYQDVWQALGPPPTPKVLSYQDPDDPTRGGG